MRVLIDISHPAHAHFFKIPAKILALNGHKVMITSREKDVAIELLNELNIHHKTLSKQGRGLFRLGVELISRNLTLYNEVRKFRPDVMAAIGGTSIAQVGWLCGIPSLVFYDTENAVLQNTITYPFATWVIVPSSYSNRLPKRNLKYAGYHELSYLHPNHFKANINIAHKNGLKPNVDNFFIRIVSWEANHDIGDNGWSESFIETLIHYLQRIGNIIISSEKPLPVAAEKYRYTGKISEIHHTMAFCRLYIGESATMASESVIMGVPSIYIANTSRGYIEEQATKYRLMKIIKGLKWNTVENAITELLCEDSTKLKEKHDRILQDTVDVAKLVVNLTENYNASETDLRQIIQDEQYKPNKRS